MTPEEERAYNKTAEAQGQRLAEAARVFWKSLADAVHLEWILVRVGRLAQRLGL